MATYLKRSSKLFERLAASENTTTRRRIAEPPLCELICPICRTILREPVTLPCSHNLCLRCLRGTVEHNSLSCPLCRQRVGSWLRARTKNENLVNAELWQLIRRRYPEELELAAAGVSSDSLELDSGFIPKTILSAAGEIRREYEVQLQIAEEEMRRQQEKERLASEALIRKLQEEEQSKLVQLAQDQLLAKTLAKQEVIEKTNSRSSKTATLVSSNESKPSVVQSNTNTNQKMVRSKNAANSRKQNTALVSKFKFEKNASNAKSNTTVVHKEPAESHKPVPIHNAVTRVVTHQNQGELIGSTSKIYGLQSKEELHVPSDVISSKKKKLGVEVCVTTIEGEERIGSAESAGSHDSINQEIHHFKPIKALPRTPLKVTDGRQYDPKLIRVLPMYKKNSTAVPKPPSQTHLKKTLGCSWSAFKRITTQQQVLQKESTTNQPQDTKKTDKKSEQSKTVSKSNSKQQVQEIDERTTEVTYDSNDNYTKNINKIINGTKVSKKLNLDDQTEVKPAKRAKVKNGLLPIKNKSQKDTNNEKVIEVVDLEDDGHQEASTNGNLTKNDERTPDPLAFTPRMETRPTSPVYEFVMENIAERIKRRKASRTTSNSENIQSAMNSIPSTATKAKSKKPTKTAPSKAKAPKIVASTTTSKTSSTTSLTTTTSSSSSTTTTTTTTAGKSRTKTKVPVTTTITSQIKRLAARSSKRPRYTEDSESEDEIYYRETETNDTKPPTKESTPVPSPAKKPRKVTTKKPAKPKKSQAKQPPQPPAAAAAAAVKVTEELVIKEQEKFEELISQEQKDLELAMQLQARFDAMERVAGRTRRGAANRPSSPGLDQLLHERRPQKRALVQ